MAADKTWKKRRRRRRDFDYRLYYPNDGMEVNNILPGQKVSRYKYNMTIYESDNVYIRNEDGSNSQISIMHKLRLANRYRSSRVNPDRDRLNRKA